MAAVLALLCASIPASARVTKHRVRRHPQHPKAAHIEPVTGEFLADGVPIKEFHCVPSSSGEAPVVMLLHGCAPEHFGATTFKRMCVSLAQHGYYAMFIEYYGAEGAPSCRDLAMTPSYSVAPDYPLPDDVWIRDLIAARDSLTTSPRADATRLGLIGFSFGGTLAVIAEALHPGLARTIVDYYGFSNQRVQDAVSRLRSFPPTLILQGDSDHREHVVDSIHLHNVIADRQPASDIRVYPQVEHAFNFHDAVGYDKEASEDAWSRTLSFLDRHLK